MGSSGGGGSSKSPTQATPSGTITEYGSATPFSPHFPSVLSNGMGWADVGEIDAANDSNATAAAAAAAAPPAAAAADNPLTSADAFAKKLLDYQKQQQMSAYMLALDPRTAGQYISTMQSAPKATTPTEQLMVQALQSRQSGGGGNRWYQGGGGHLR